MEEKRRSGTERRQNHIPPEEERRTTSERRELLLMPDRTKERLMGMLIFSGMNIEEIIAVVSICAKKEIRANTVLYMIGDPSDDMLILVKGTLAVLSRGGVELQTYEPYDAIGEMGIFTDEPRSATVKAVTDVTVLRDRQDGAVSRLRHQPRPEGKTSHQCHQGGVRQAPPSERDCGAAALQDTAPGNTVTG